MLKIEILNQSDLILPPQQHWNLFAKFSDWKESMSVKKQILSLCKLFSFYDEIPEDFPEKTGVEKYFYHKIFAFSHSQHRKAWVRKGSNKRFCKYIVQNLPFEKNSSNKSSETKWIFPKENSVLWLRSFRDFLKTFDQTSKSVQFYIPNSKSKLDLQKKTVSFLLTVKISLNMKADKFY